MTARRPPGARPRAIGRQARAQPLQLAVHGDAQGLEGEGGRIQAGPPRAAAPRGAPRRASSAVVAQARLPAGGHDGAGDAPRGALLAVAVDEVGQGGLGQAVHQVGGGGPARCGPCACRAGRRAWKLKPRSGVSSWSELTPRSSRTPSGGSAPGARAARGSRRAPACTRSPNAASRSRARARVSASRSRPSRRPAGARAAQDLLGVAAQADRAVDVEAARPHREQLQGFLEAAPARWRALHIRSRTPRGRGRPRR